MIRLSEAIRLGSMLKPQIFGEATDGVGTCALMAGIEAAGLKLRPVRPEEYGTPTDRAARSHAGDYVVEFPPEWRWATFAGKRVDCPVCEQRESVYRLIPHLNDQHRWTREAVADFIATIEPPEQAQPEAVEQERVEV
jgi:hypothetical protein